MENFRVPGTFVPGTFRSQGTTVPWNFRSRALSFPENESSWELSLLGPFIPGNFRSHYPIGLVATLLCQLASSHLFTLHSYLTEKNNMNTP